GFDLPRHPLRSYTAPEDGRGGEGRHTRSPMLQSRRECISLLAAILLFAVGPAAAEPLFTLSEDGKTFLYRARPGDHPGGVAEMFGISQRDVPAFLAANGISDATRVGAGFVYRIPNAAARALVVRTATLGAENACFKHIEGVDRAEAERLGGACE